MSVRKGGCVCRVPVTECAIPAGQYERDALAFLEARGIDVAPDHMGRLSVLVADAQQLWDETAERAAKEVEKQAQLRNEVAEANRERAAIQARVFNETLQSVGGNAAGHRKAVTAAWNAVREYDRGLSRAVRDRLDALPVDNQTLIFPGGS